MSRIPEETMTVGEMLEVVACIQGEKRGEAELEVRKQRPFSVGG